MKNILILVSLAEADEQRSRQKKSQKLCHIHRHPDAVDAHQHGQDEDCGKLKHQRACKGGYG